MIIIDRGEFNFLRATIGNRHLLTKALNVAYREVPDMQINAWAIEEIKRIRKEGTQEFKEAS